MATWERFEDIEAWQEARKLTRCVYAITRQGDFARDFELRGQIRRASASIMSNIAEGFDRDGGREFIQFLAISKGSTAEVRSQLYVALDAGYLNEADFRALNDDCLRIGRMLAGLMSYLRNSSYKGAKFKSTRHASSQPKTPEPPQPETRN